MRKRVTYIGKGTPVLLNSRRAYALRRRANPVVPSELAITETLSPPAKAALWIGSIATIITAGGALLAYLWPLPNERLYYRGVAFDVRRSGGTWTARYAVNNEMFSVNGTTRDDLIAHVHDQVDALLSPQVPVSAKG